MNILVAPDKFKGSLTAKEVCAAIESGLLKIDSSLSIKLIPMADGGEGTCELLTDHSKGSMISTEVCDPLFRKITASYGVSGDGSTAFIEMASASGLALLSKEERNPLKTSTYGTGELIADAITRGVNKIILTIGGSATNDAGLGMAAALGVKFLNQENETLAPIGENLVHLYKIQFDKFILNNKKISFVVLCDVDNELYGKNGAAYVYAPQKGADEEAVQLLDWGLRNFEQIAKSQCNQEVNFKGAGAAGGLGAGALLFLNAEFNSGIDFILKTLHVEEQINWADLIITGEGKMDVQTLSGKVVMGVAQLATKYGKPTIAIVGKNELAKKDMDTLGLKEVIALVNEKTNPAEAMRNAASLLSVRIEEHQVLKKYL
ncbi:MAG: glycerate kinase [Cyclobacteriaceae bacterium]|jgi:glycerate kinase|nr:glycerate kinase [Cyclobacteriaceae bacterium]